jgi:hypothetical protein
MHVFDRGYIDYKRFDDYCKHGIRFTSRLKDSAIVTVISENPVIPEGRRKIDYQTEYLIIERQVLEAINIDDLLSPFILRVSSHPRPISCVVRALLRYCAGNDNGIYFHPNL